MNGSPVRSWSIRNGSLNFDSGSQLMGIVNTTPDSFSDGGSFALQGEQNFLVDTEKAVRHALRLEREGASILDLGGQSTRPGSHRVSPDEEIRRTIPLIRILASKTSLPISIDTYYAQVAEEACRAGASIINDISAGTFDPDLLDVARKYDCGIVLSHIQGTPDSMQIDPVYHDVVKEIMDFLDDRKNECTRAGIKPDKIALDPGIGFGKTIGHNLTILANIERFHTLGSPLLIGHSRKSFLIHFLSEDHRDLFQKTTIRDELTAQISRDLSRQGVQILRVHNPEINRKSLC